MGAKDVNVHVLTGGIVRDPELDELKDGKKVLRLRVASNNRRKDKEKGEWADDTQYFDVAVFGKTAESLASWLKKGTQVAVEGRGRTFLRAVTVDKKRIVDAAGNPVRREHYEIVADVVRVMDRPRRTETAGDTAHGGGAAEVAAPEASEEAEYPVDLDEEYGALLGADIEF